MLPHYDRTYLQSSVRILHNKRVEYLASIICVSYETKASKLIFNKLEQMYLDNKDLIDDYMNLCKPPLRVKGTLYPYMGNSDTICSMLKENNIPIFDVKLEEEDVPGLKEIGLDLLGSKDKLTDSYVKFNDIIVQIIYTFGSTKYLYMTFPELIPLLPKNKFPKKDWLPNPTSYRKYRTFRKQLEEENKINDLITYLGQASIEGTLNGLSTP